MLPRTICIFATLLLILASSAIAETGRREVSGIYPHLAMFNDERECGTGAVVPWADRLWVVTYAPHSPEGSSDKLYEITPDLQQIVRAESIGGTPANRMIHRESQQLFIGPYAIDAERNVRAIPYSEMFGRPTGLARHLSDPASKIVFATMEEGIYEVDVDTLAVQELWADEQQECGRKAALPGYHGKGFYSAQGRYVYANNGDHAAAARVDPNVPSGVLATWDGQAEEWTVVRRNQFTEVTGPGGLEGNGAEDDRLWSIGWDNRSLILALLENGQWHSFRLPKTSHCYDGAHGWNTEWPRIRDIGEEKLLMTMHGQFWQFPKTFSAGNTAGIVPRSSYLKVIGDFCRWQDRVVFGCDDTARGEFLNKDPLKGGLAAPGQSQSNLWFVEPGKLDTFGPPLGRGAVWLNDDVPSYMASDPFLFSGFDRRSMYFTHQSSESLTLTIEVDTSGQGEWHELRREIVPPGEDFWVEFDSQQQGQWIRLSLDLDGHQVSAFFHYRDDDRRPEQAAEIFEGIAKPSGQATSSGLLYAQGDDMRSLRFLAEDDAGPLGCYELDGQLVLRQVEDEEGAAWMEQNVGITSPQIEVDSASLLYIDPDGNRWRLPKGNAMQDEAITGVMARVCREVCTERNLLNVGGTFYELPAPNAGGFAKLRPIATHDRQIHDYASYRGLLVMSGIDHNAEGDHIVRSEDGKCALWVGSVDDLWSLGKPRGQGGPWLDTQVEQGKASDPYLATGYDQTVLTLSHQHPRPVRIIVEADFTGTGEWATVAELDVQPSEELEYRFADGFGAYWLRFKSSENTVATAQLDYR
ncbi:hypothetical protein NG895_07700 [Aeoliella sp. ICT_H6.2]|uniref:Uncharacterized protein n=1 Tax=Aeoliella straminimaris TaxID=2954799 RepID=A0A9X2F8U1_9BACT|nr:hypothetical protein [Aeoliella straminimaris]MCO6043788.1 hypothetical protein [Aeoliella straminimaris]